jgi:hypothetical protein
MIIVIDKYIVTDALIDLIFDSVEPPLDTSTPLTKKYHFNRFYGDTYKKVQLSTA